MRVRSWQVLKTRTGIRKSRRRGGVCIEQPARARGCIHCIGQSERQPLIGSRRRVMRRGTRATATVSATPALTLLAGEAIAECAGERFKRRPAQLVSEGHCLRRPRDVNGIELRSAAGRVGPPAAHRLGNLERVHDLALAHLPGPWAVPARRSIPQASGRTNRAGPVHGPTNQCST